MYQIGVCSISSSVHLRSLPFCTSNCRLVCTNNRRLVYKYRSAAVQKPTQHSTAVDLVVAQRHQIHNCARSLSDNQVIAATHTNTSCGSSSSTMDTDRQAVHGANAFNGSSNNSEGLDCRSHPLADLLLTDGDILYFEDHGGSSSAKHWATQPWQPVSQQRQWQQLGAIQPVQNMQQPLPGSGELLTSSDSMLVDDVLGIDDDCFVGASAAVRSADAAPSSHKDRQHHHRRHHHHKQQETPLHNLAAAAKAVAVEQWRETADSISAYTQPLQHAGRIIADSFNTTVNEINRSIQANAIDRGAESVDPADSASPVEAAAGVANAVIDGVGHAVYKFGHDVGPDVTQAGVKTVGEDKAAAATGALGGKYAGIGMRKVGASNAAAATKQLGVVGNAKMIQELGPHGLAQLAKELGPRRGARVVKKTGQLLLTTLLKHIKNARSEAVDEICMSAARVRNTTGRIDGSIDDDVQGTKVVGRLVLHTVLVPARVVVEVLRLSALAVVTAVAGVITGGLGVLQRAAKVAEIFAGGLRKKRSRQ
eukprot:GHRR01013465.1.p1 GENE.GHRR01013465.1~~GHRR01013465.1.p1  ORF type:complete len:536 (-),score=169.08 GHRR01013465.1:257-1864(-)